MTIREVMILNHKLSDQLDSANLTSYLRFFFEVEGDFGYANFEGVADNDLELLDLLDANLPYKIGEYKVFDSLQSADLRISSKYEPSTLIDEPGLTASYCIIIEIDDSYMPSH